MGCEASDASAASVPHSDFPSKYDKEYYELLKPSSLLQANKLFAHEQFAQAAAIYQQYIEDHGTEIPTNIDGLGQLLISLGYYQWNLYKHYRQGVKAGKYIGTVYDALSLCYQALKDRNDADEVQKGTKWYQGMVDDYPDNYAIIMGYANHLCNDLVFDEAIDYYERVIKMKPNWTRPYECLAYIYEYKRILKTKSKEMANKLLELEGNNRAALFILGRNTIDPEEKIKNLTKATIHHPQYARAFNEIGIVYGGTLKKYQDAIDWYAKASSICPEYSSCYNNVGVNLQLLKRFDQAMDWYFRAIEKDTQYKAPHANLKDIFEELKYTDQQISAQMQKYKIKPDYFYYYMGLGYHDAKKYEKAIEYFDKSFAYMDTLGKSIEKIHNSKGITLDDMRKNAEAIQCYNAAIKANPKYHSAYYNAAIVFKRENKLEDAKKWYNMAIEANKRYSYAYNNLANILKNELKYEEAIKHYKNAIKYNSTYTLALTNMGVCYLLIGKYREAFNAMRIAKECLPHDNNNLSAGNKSFLNENISKFDKEGQTWRRSGGISQEQKEKLKSLIKNFDSTFKSLFSNTDKQPISRDKVLKNQILNIVRIIAEDKFQLNHIDDIFYLIKMSFDFNEEYFHILPQIYMQYFYDSVLIRKKPVLEIERQLLEVTKRLSEKTEASLLNEEKQVKGAKRNATIKMHNFNPPNNNKVDLFTNNKYFDSYEHIYSQIIHVNEETGKSRKDFQALVDFIKNNSYGEIFGVGMKLPEDERFHFKVILRIFQKMFKKEMTREKVEQIISKIDKKVKEKQKDSSKHIQIGDVMRDVTASWTEQITKIVKKRRQQKVETKCEVSDLLRGKLMYNTYDHLKKAIDAVDQICKEKNYQIIEMDNRLTKRQTQDVVFKIQIKAAICELQLAMKQDQTQYHFTHCIYEIQRSPLGVIFGSYLFMTKGFNYPFLDNCRDIVEHLKGSPIESDKKTAESAQYIVDCLTQKTQA